MKSEITNQDILAIYEKIVELSEKITDNNEKQRKMIYTFFIALITIIFIPFGIVYVSDHYDLLNLKEQTKTINTNNWDNMVRVVSDHIDKDDCPKPLNYDWLKSQFKKMVERGGEMDTAYLRKFPKPENDYN